MDKELGRVVWVHPGAAERPDLFLDNGKAKIVIILTIDTDWASEEATKAVLEKLKVLPIKTTVFFSTPSPVQPWPLLEVGCHPDLSRRQGLPVPGSGLERATTEHDLAVRTSEGEILGDYRHSFPEVRTVRTHRFYWHSDLPKLMVGHGFSHDSSLIMPFHPGLKGFRVGKLLRWPVWSSDHLHLARKLPLNRLAMPHWFEGGLKIFCFHVAYLYYNTSCLEDLNLITATAPSGNGEARPDRGKAGVWDLFLLLAEAINRQSQGNWLGDIPPDFILSNEVF